MLLRNLRQAALLCLTLTLLTGVLYPVAMTAMAQICFPQQAQGSLIKVDNRLVGSRLIGQQFRQPAYFWGRPSATSPVPYHAAASSGSNLSPTNPAQREAIDARIQELRNANPESARQALPRDLLTASGSGLDPHISPAAARFQMARVAQARKIPVARLDELVQRYTEGRQWGLLGEPRVNVLLLNLALDQQFPSTSR